MTDPTPLTAERDRPEWVRAVLLDLEEAAGEADPALNTPGDLRGAVAFASTAYRWLHWPNSPNCRKNHLDWEPKPSQAAIDAASRPPAQEERT